MSTTHCAIENCRTTILNKPPGVSFHPCPQTTEMRNRWLKVLKNRCSMLDWAKSRICSKHFEHKYFDAQRRLKDNAIPTMFAQTVQKPPARKKERGEHWSNEEKEILKKVMADSSHILDSKCTKDSTKDLKNTEWKNVTVIFNEVTGKIREPTELKRAWKRIKMVARENDRKRNETYHSLPSNQENVEMMAITAKDVILHSNMHDYEAQEILVDSPLDVGTLAGPSMSHFIPVKIMDHAENNEQTINAEEVSRKDQILNEESRKSKSNSSQPKKIKRRYHMRERMQKSIVDSIVNFKKRHLEMLELEHSYNITISKLKVKKLRLEVDLLRNKNNLI